MSNETLCADLEQRLVAAVTHLAPAGILLGCRTVRAGDEACLLPEEQHAITTRDPGARRASGAARHVARDLLATLGHPNISIGRKSTGQPIWPDGIVGSLAHDDEVAVAAAASCEAARSLGIDVEPVFALSDDIATLVISIRDKPGDVAPHLAGRLIFAAKEAVYKAMYPLDGVMLDYVDIDVDLRAASAQTRTGHSLQIQWCLSPRIVVLAVLAR